METLIHPDNLKSFSQIVAGLATVAIASMDLSVDYTDDEKKIYGSKFFQILAVFAIAYLFTEDITKTLITVIIWLVIKYIPFKNK